MVVFVDKCIYFKKIGQLEDVQRRLPHSLDSDVLMANCSWEYIVLWNKDPEVVSSLLHSVEYLQCIQNAVLQHGVCIMMWNMFLKKKLMTTAQLIEKVGKAPKDRLCRRDVGLSDIGLVKFVETMCEFLKTMMQVGHQDITTFSVNNANCNVSEIPIFNIEDMWQTIKGPTPLAELAVDQRETNYGLLLHHFHLTVVLNAILEFTMKSVKPISLFDAKGKAAFFKELHSHPLLPTARTTDSSVRDIRKQFMKRVIANAVQTLRDPDEKSVDNTSLKSKEQPHIKWPSLMQTLAEDFGLDQDELTRHHVLELYSIAEDKLAEEILLAVSDNAVMGSQLLLLAGQRVAHFMLKCDPPGCTEMLANMSPTLSTWIRQLDFSTLHCANPPLSDTATLMGHVVNQLAEGHSEYNLAIALVEVVQGLM
ncbi:unnamed protein product [Owenia fusiformis]|uniref:Rab3GAP regulatory subunit C-terminal domain-containing protein n=1 Tax=Owenia fusiformis TaxID=6347 RepID=A0A8S4PE62_OWEFU|nr:unnamed protein product [Owenia fusiformis]